MHRDARQGHKRREEGWLLCKPLCNTQWAAGLLCCMRAPTVTRRLPPPIQPAQRRPLPSQDAARLHTFHLHSLSIDGVLLSTLPSEVVERWTADFVDYVKWIKQRLPQVCACVRRREAAKWQGDPLLGLDRGALIQRPSSQCTVDRLGRCLPRPQLSGGGQCLNLGCPPSQPLQRNQHLPSHLRSPKAPVAPQAPKPT